MLGNLKVVVHLLDQGANPNKLVLYSEYNLYLINICSNFTCTVHKANIYLV